MAHADEIVFLWINGWVGSFPLFDGVMEEVVSDYLAPVSLALTLLGLWFVGSSRAIRQKHQLGVIAALIAMGLSSWAVQISNGLYFRPRPFVDLNVSLLFYRPTDSSFPANSAAAAFAIAAAVWGFNRRVGACLLALAGLYGFSRVYAGVHYPLDIVGGAMIGVVVAVVAFKIVRIADPILTRLIKAARIFCLA